MKFIKSKADYRHLIAGGIAASLTASICCIGPLVLLTTGVSGAWMSKLMLFEQYQAFLITATLLAFAFAGRSLFFAGNAMRDGDCCEESGLDWKKASVFAASSCLALVFISSEYWIQFVL